MKFRKPLSMITAILMLIGLYGAWGIPGSGAGTEKQVWHSVIFGQNTKADKNFIEPAKPGTIEGTIRLTALDGGGKITGAHDGIAFYYTEIDAATTNFILSADIKVIAFGKPAADNQEGFGLMARDAIGEDGNATMFSSNVAAVGGYSGKTQAFIRTGSANPYGNEGIVQTATKWDTQRPAEDNTHPAKPYRLTLQKTNSGYIASLNGEDATTVTFYQPDALQAQDSKIYVGFYVARVATIEISNVMFAVSDAAFDPPKVTEPPKPVAPGISVVSLPASSKSGYTMKLMSNVNGTVSIVQDGVMIASDEAVLANTVYEKNTLLTANATTNFLISFTPDETQLLTFYGQINKNFSVVMKTYETPDGAIHVSPEGKQGASGTADDPLDIDTAVSYVKEGQTILLHGGTYERSSSVRILSGNDGSAAAVKKMAAYNGETVVFDFRSLSSGIILGANYWHIYGIDVTNSNGLGFSIGGSYNRIELCKAYANETGGIQINRTGNVSREFWPSYNLILNCEAYDNKDAAENNADGFSAKLTSGVGNVFRGCVSYSNIDDGWDLYTKVELGPIGAVLIEDCIAYNNGTLTNGYVGRGDKTGFKLGGEGMAVPHVIRNSLAFQNGAVGFTSNGNPSVSAYDCVSYDNDGANIAFTSYEGIPLNFTIDGFVSYRSKKGAGDRYPSDAVSDNNYFNDGTVSKNKSGKVLTNSDFESVTPSLPYRWDENGTLIRGDFLKLKNGEIKGDISGHWAETSIKTLAGKGIMKGYPDGSFKPDHTITRAEFVVMLAAAFSLGDAGGRVFQDTAAHWAKDAATAAEKAGIVSGYDKDRFGPDDKITREQIAVMIVRAAGLSGSWGNRFADENEISEWAKTAVETASAAGIIAGYPDNTFRPQGAATRAEAAVVLDKALKRKGIDADPI